MSTQSGRTSPTSLAPGVGAGSLAPDPGGARRQVWYEIASGASGFLLALFMWGHMLLVGSILLGAKGFNWVAGILEHYFIAQPTVIVVLVLFLVHAVMASRKIPAQLKERKGCIINVTSIAGVTGQGSSIAYAASKAGIIALTKSVAKELGGRGVTGIRTSSLESIAAPSTPMPRIRRRRCR